MALVGHVEDPPRQLFDHVVVAHALPAHGRVAGAGLGGAGLLQVLLWFGMAIFGGLATASGLELIGFEMPWFAMAMALPFFVAGFRALRRGRFDVVRTCWQGYRKGRRARFLHAMDWSEWLPRPLAEVRRHLRLQPASYRPLELEGVAGAAD